MIGCKRSKGRGGARTRDMTVKCSAKTITLRLTIGLFAFAMASACEDDPPQMKRGGERPPPTQKPGGQAAAQTGAKAGTGANATAPKKGAPANAKVPGDAANAAAQKPRRVPTAGELLGLGRDGGSVGDALPAFISKRDEYNNSPLFKGRVVKPSPDYAGMRVELSDVSVNERSWGRDPAESEEAVRRKLHMNSMAAPAASTQIFKSDEPAEDEPEEADKASEAKAKKGRSAEAERKYHLVMYRLNEKTGKVETFDRRYASQKAMDAAARFASNQGYAKEKPSAAKLKQLAEAKAKKKAEAEAKKRAAAAAACPFKATWTEKGVTQTRCFKTQKAANAFSQARVAATRKQPGAPAARPASGPGVPKNAPVPSQGGIQPVKIGQ